MYLQWKKVQIEIKSYFKYYVIHFYSYYIASGKFKNK